MKITFHDVPRENREGYELKCTCMAYQSKQLLNMAVARYGIRTNKLILLSVSRLTV